MRILFTIFPAASLRQPTMEYIGMDVHNRYCQGAIVDDDSTDPDECRLRPLARRELGRRGLR
jgi:hypothetical protein